MALFLYSFNTVAPLILVVAVGFLLKKLRMVDDAFISKANKVCFQVAFPLQLFHNIYAADFGAEFRVKLVLFTLLGVLATAILLCLVTPRFLKTGPRAARLFKAFFAAIFCCWACLWPSIYSARIMWRQFPCCCPLLSWSSTF